MELVDGLSKNSQTSDKYIIKINGKSITSLSNNHPHALYLAPLPNESPNKQQSGEQFLISRMEVIS